jgi:hypothetical protein
VHEGNKRHSSECCHLAPARPSCKEGWRKGGVFGSKGIAMGSGLEEGAPEKNS